MRDLIQRLRGSLFIRDTATLTVGTAGAQLITIAVMPLLSRLYSPAEFGVWAIFQAVSSISATFVTLRYETSILLPKNDEDAFRLVWLSGLLTIGLGSLLVFIAWILPDSFKKILGFVAIEEYLPVSILAGISTAILAIGNNWLNRGCAYGKMSMLRLAQSVALSGNSLLLGRYGFSDGLLISQVFALLLTSLLMFWLLRNTIVSYSAHNIIALAKNYSHAPKYLLPTALLDIITLQLPILLITAWFSSEMAGQFSMAWKILALPAALIGTAAGQVFYQKISKKYQDGKSIKKYYYKFSLVMLIVSLPMLILISLYGESIFVYFLGKKWVVSGKISEILIFSSVIYFIFSPSTSTFIVLRKELVLLLFSIFQLSYRGLLFFIFNDILDYIKILVIFEIINVLLIEATLIYFLNKK